MLLEAAWQNINCILQALFAAWRYTSCFQWSPTIFRNPLPGAGNSLTQETALSFYPSLGQNNTLPSIFSEIGKAIPSLADAKLTAVPRYAAYDL
ncbi:MAG: hypothetical protein KGZ80_00915 [Methylomonas sp.]|nr:hypothetical protein [Methylomonas sp.]